MRAGGILLHISSLPGNYGIGTFGDRAYGFVDFLAKAGQKYWQVLPLGPTSHGDSPYQTFSAFAGNPYLIDLDLLVRAGLLMPEECQGLEPKRPNWVDYAQQYQNRFPVLKATYRRFTGNANSRGSRSRLLADDYALFMAIKSPPGRLVEWDFPTETGAGRYCGIHRQQS